MHRTDAKAKVLAADNGRPSVTVNTFGKGKGVYLSSFEMTDENTRLLMNLILYAAGENIEQQYVTSNPCTECAYYPESKTLVMINNTETLQKTSVKAGGRNIDCEIEGYDIMIQRIE